MPQATHIEIIDFQWCITSFALASLLWWRIDQIRTERALHSVDFAGIRFSRNALEQYQTYHDNAFLKPYKQTAEDYKPR